MKRDKEEEKREREPVEEGELGESKLEGAEAEAEAEADVEKVRRQGEKDREEFSLKGGETSASSLSGEKFLQEYYKCLSDDLEELVEFYHEDAVMTLQYEEGSTAAVSNLETPLSPIGREINRQPVVEGKANIGKRLKYIYNGRRATVTSIDCQMSSRGTMLLVATGILESTTLRLSSPSMDDGSPPSPPSPPVYANSSSVSVPFMQSFIVTCLDSEFKIINDILRRSDPGDSMSMPPSSSSTMTAVSVPQLASDIGTPVIAPRSRDSKLNFPATLGSTAPNTASVKSKSSSGSRKSSSSRRRRKDRSRPTPKRLFQPVSITESLVEENKKGKGNNLVALMTFIASLCEVLVNSVWSAVAILHVVGTLSLLLSVSAMFLKSRNDLLAVDQKAREMENAFQSAAEELDTVGERLGNIDMSSFSKVESNLKEKPTYKSFDIIHSESGSEEMMGSFNSEAYLDNSRYRSSPGAYLGSYSGSALLTSLQNGEFPVKVGGLFKEET